MTRNRNWILDASPLILGVHISRGSFFLLYSFLLNGSPGKNKISLRLVWSVLIQIHYQWYYHTSTNLHGSRKHERNSHIHSDILVEFLQIHHILESLPNRNIVCMHPLIRVEIAIMREMDAYLWDERTITYFPAAKLGLLSVLYLTWHALFLKNLFVDSFLLSELILCCLLFHPSIFCSSCMILKPTIGKILITI